MALRVFTISIAFKKRIGMTQALSKQNAHCTRFDTIEQSLHSLDALSLNSDFSGTLKLSKGKLFSMEVIQVSQFLGYNPEDIRNKPFMNLISDEDLTKGKDAIDSIINGKNIFSSILSLISKDGSSVPRLFRSYKGNSTFWFVKKQLVLSS